MLFKIETSATSALFTNDIRNIFISIAYNKSTLFTMKQYIIKYYRPI